MRNALSCLTCAYSEAVMRPEQKLFTFRSWKYHDNVKEGLSNPRWRDAFKDGLKEVRKLIFHPVLV